MILDGEDFTLDLLFYHRLLKRLVAMPACTRKNAQEKKLTFVVFFLLMKWNMQCIMMRGYGHCISPLTGAVYGTVVFVKKGKGRHDDYAWQNNYKNGNMHIFST